MYVTYEFYSQNGGTITDSTAFFRYEYMSEQYLRGITSERIDNMTAIPESVQRLMIELIDIDYSANLQTQISVPLVTSVSNDGVSESYKVMDSQLLDVEKAKLVKQYLSGVCDDYNIWLLYRGS